jgi:archaellin
MRSLKKIVLVAVLAVTAIAALPAVSTGAFAQCPPKCTNN